MSDLTKLQAVSALPRARVALCLNSELRAELDELERALAGELAKDNDDDAALNMMSLAEPSRATELTARLDSVRQRVHDATVEFEFTALKRSEFAALEETHPTKDDVYPFTFWCALISASLTSHSLSAEETRTWLQDSLSQGQVDTLCSTAWSVNRESGETQIPFSDGGSAPNR